MDTGCASPGICRVCPLLFWHSLLHVLVVYKKKKILVELLKIDITVFLHS
ncbi:unnamed protein product, partial [Vitis vinifera]|uniref:Uncharacterized protein n=1 Tax=Vitis vinifera TaxID=29760 RepID=D7TF93_VITVI